MEINWTQVHEAAGRARLTDWSNGRGEVFDAIWIPHPPGELGCWGDSPDDLELVELMAVKRLCPGRKVMLGDVDETGEYLILSP